MFSLFKSFDTTYTACSVEFLPQGAPLVACGTYQLFEADAASNTAQRKVGRLLLFDVDSEPWSPLQTIETAAILDMKWFVIRDIFLFGCFCFCRICLLHLVIDFEF